MGVAKVPEQDCAMRLTPRERDVLRLVVAGMSSKQAAKQLHLSVRTVENHVQAAMRRTGTPNRTALAVLVAERGLL